MSHELRTPLNAIIGFSQLLELPHLENDPEKRREYVSDILKSSEHLLDLINDLLDLSKIEAGRAELYETRVSVIEIMETVLDMVRPLAQNAGLTVTLDQADRNIALHADAQKLRQIVLNLLSNAIKFTPRGGQVRAAVTRDARNWLNISVIDTGIGIAAEDMERILSPFEQAHEKINREHPGTGLGLPLAKGLVELHGGHLKLKSKPGKSTTATVSFPPQRVLEENQV